MRKRILSVILTLCLLCTLLPAAALPASAAKSDTDIAYPVEGGNIYFDKTTGTITDCDTSVTKADIPAEIDGVAVTSIGDEAFYNCYSLTSVTIPDSVTSIGNQAFERCSSLTSVTIGSSVTNIGGSAFLGCRSLTSVIIPDSVTSIDGSAFHGCSSLTSVTIPNGVTSIDWGTFRDCSSLTSVTIPNSVTYIGSGAFRGCSSLTSVTIPESVTHIASGAFSGCSSLTGIWVDENNLSYSSDAFGVLFNIDKTELIQAPGAIPEYTIPDSVTSISWDAFEGCSSLTSVTIPDSVTSIGGSAFSNCSSLTSVMIPNGVTNINNWAFSGCSSLTSVTIGSSVTSIGQEAFEDCSSLTSVTIPDSVTNIGLYAFYGCSSLTSVTIGNSVTSIGSSAFGHCRSLTSVTIPDSVTSIGNQAFEWCSSLMSVTIPDSVTSIGNYAFSYCGSLTSVTIPEGVTSIGNYAFSYCSSLTSVTIPESVTSIGSNAFERCTSLTSVYFEGNAPEIGESVFQMWDTETKEYVNIPNLTLYYIEGKDGWTSPTWNGYPTATWMPVHEHVYAEVVTAPTCIEKGYTTYTCTICGDSYVDTYIDALGHNYGEWTQTKAPNCTEKGEEKRTCSHCDAFETREIEANGHTEVVDAAVPATCTEAGKTEGKHCSVCNTVLVSQETIAALGHDYGEWAQTKAPTCTEKGEEKRICSRCGFFETRELDVTDHTEVVDPALAATCTKAGKTEGKHCSVCGTVLVAQNTVDALGHDYGEWTQTKEPTCTDKGEEKRTCSRCDAFETREIEAHGHTEVVDAAVPATCTEAGKTEGKHCSVCNTVLVAQETIAPLGHNYGEWTQTIAPTCTEKGEEKRVCSRCDAFETREIEANGHTEVVDAAVPATCTEAGKTEGKHCSVCNTVLVAQETVAALGHDYQDGVCTRCGEKDPDWVEPKPPESYEDVSEDAWYYDAVQYATKNGLMNGVGDNEFDPEGSMTRAMLVTVLWRYAGEPMGCQNPFSDVPSGQWYTDAVAWAAANEIVGGVGGNRFDPDGNVTREQMATILFRYANKTGIDTSKRGELGTFPDAGKISSYARDAIAWTVAEGIINGSDGRLLPQGDATRAQVSAILMRFIENIVKK